MDREWSSVTLEGLPAVARDIIGLADQERVWLLEGPMGAGKTTFIKAICAELGVLDVVNSPTFSLVNEYLTEAGDTVYHFDFYRMEDPREAQEIGVEEYFDSGSICLLEWPSKIEPFLPDSYLTISLEPTGATTRRIVCSHYE